jgi:hypothetical protein
MFSSRLIKMIAHSKDVLNECLRRSIRAVSDI